MDLLEGLKQDQFTTEEECLRYLEMVRWPEGVRCPQCGHENISHFQSKGKTGKMRRLYQCLERSCRYQFSATTGTIFHDSHLPLGKWFEAILLLNEAKDTTPNQLRLALGIQYKTATHLSRRIGEAMRLGSIELTSSTSIVGLAHTELKSAALRAQPARTSRTRSQASQAPDIIRSGRPESAQGTTVDNMLTMFVSLAQMTVQPPLFFVNYIKDKVFT